MENDIHERTGDISLEDLSRITHDGLAGIDSETSGLDWRHDELALVQIASAGEVYIVYLNDKRPTQLVTLLENIDVLKVFHHALFDLRFFDHRWSIEPQNIACTKVCSKIVQPDAESHSLKPLLRSYFGLDLERESALSNWFDRPLTDKQLRYAANDVLHLQRLLGKLEETGRSKGLEQLINAAFSFIPWRLKLDMAGLGDVFEY